MLALDLLANCGIGFQPSTNKSFVLLQIGLAPFQSYAYLGLPQKGDLKLLSSPQL